FQAEDGIRDGHVTGVQTCALPIFPVALVWAAPSSGSTSTLVGRATFRSFKVERKQLPVKDTASGRWAGESERTRRRRPIWEVEEIGRASCRERGKKGEAGGEQKE